MRLSENTSKSADESSSIPFKIAILRVYRILAIFRYTSIPIPSRHKLRLGAGLNHHDVVIHRLQAPNHLVPSWGRWSSGVEPIFHWSHPQFGSYGHTPNLAEWIHFFCWWKNPSSRWVQSIPVVISPTLREVSLHFRHWDPILQERISHVLGSKSCKSLFFIGPKCARGITEPAPRRYVASHPGN